MKGHRSRAGRARLLGLVAYWLGGVLIEERGREGRTNLRAAICESHEPRRPLFPIPRESSNTGA
jgi:hypothetical protein